MHTNLEARPFASPSLVHEQVSDPSSSKPSPKPRSDSAPPRLAPPSKHVTGRNEHRTPVPSGQVNLQDSSSVRGLQVSEAKQRHRPKASKKAPAQPQNLAQLVQLLKQDRPRTRQQFLQVLDKAKLQDQSPDPKNAARLFKIATYCCRSEPNAKDLTEAIGMASMLYHSQGTPAFGQLDRQKMAFDLMTRVLAPEKIDQKAYGLCGPAAFMMHTAKEDPKGFMKAALDLTFTGKARLGGMTLQPQEAVRNYNPQGQIADADWLMLGSLTNQPDILTKESEDQLGTYGGSNMSDMYNWLQTSGKASIMSVPVYTSDSILAHKAGNDAAKDLNPVLGGIVKLLSPLAVPTSYSHGKPGFVSNTAWKSAENLALAGQLARRGHTVFVTINESIANPRTVDGLEAQIPIFRQIAQETGNQQEIAKWNRSAEEITGDLVAQKINDDPKTNHWALLDNVDIREDGKVSVTVYSYGAKSTLPPIDMDTFSKVYGGFVAASDMTKSEAEGFWNTAERAEAQGYQPIL